MKRCFIQTRLTFVLLILIGLIAGKEAFAETQEEDIKNAKGFIGFDFPNAPEAKIEVNLSGKLIALVAKAAKQEPKVAKLIKMLTGVYVRGYDSDAASFDAMLRHYEDKLKKEKWEVIAKVKEKDETVQVCMLINQDTIRGIFVMAAEPTQTILVNIVGQIDPERIGELLESLGGLGLPQLKDVDIKADDVSKTKDQ